ncbi:MAG: hypothetical protein ACLR6B_10310 [Blautia sp.]
MNLAEMLEELRKEVLAQIPVLRKTSGHQKGKAPLSAFCSLCRELGYPIYEMDLIQEGEEFYASMRRSTNGGGENSPMLEGEDDFYELFFASIAFENPGLDR